MSEFYLAASLPSLSFGEPPPLTLLHFLRSAQGVLSEARLQDLRLLLEGRGAEAETADVRVWHDQETQIRNAAARHRASKRGAEASAKDRMHAGFSVWTERQVEEALSKDSPLQREKALDQVRWRAADENMQADAYGFGFVVGYAVQLQIAQRWAGLTKEKGQAEVRVHLEHNLQELKAFE